MNKLWMAAAFACLSAAAVAQSEQNKDKAPVQDQSAAASGQTAGKRMHKPLTISNEAASVKTAPTVQGGKTANDDWQATAAKSNDPKPGNGQTRVAVGDVNGDGVADATARNSGHATETLTPAVASSNVTQPRDAASGQSSGKRQHQPLTVTKVSDAKATQK